MMTEPVENSFMDFIESYTLGDGFPYEKQLSAMEQQQSTRYIIDFMDFYDFNPDFALNVYNDPKQYELTFTSLLLSKLKARNPVYAEAIENKLTIGYKNLRTATKLRDITTEHYGKLIQINGVVTSVSIPVSKMSQACFICPICGGENKIIQDSEKLVTPVKCTHGGCSNRKFRETDLNLMCSEYVNFQTMTLQENQDELPSGEIPEPIEVHLYGDLVRDVVGGNHVSIVGVVQLKETKRGSLNYKRILEANSIVTNNDSPEDYELTEAEVAEIMKLGKKPDLEKLLIQSYAPSIYGWEHVKQALLYVQFGGVRRERDKNSIRGDINLLLAGDPAIGKTQLLIYTEKLAMRGEMSTAGASLVGLTAALTKEDDRFIVNPGTMALADNGVHCVDEADKMDSAELGKAHQAMEQQFIKVDKGGLHLTLNARCANVFACNPTEGRWNTGKTLPENVSNFPDSFLTRFDLAFIMLDKSDEVFDEAMARRILGLEEEAVHETIPFDLLKKYIIYAKRINPVIKTEANMRILEYFVEKRQEKKHDTEGTHITPRQLEAFQRLMQARARMHLREEATIEDFDVVLKLFNIYINEVYRDPETGEVDFDIAHNIPASKRAKVQRTHLLFDLYIESGLGHCDDRGKSWAERKNFEAYIVSNWNVNPLTAKDIVDDAIKADYLFSPYFSRVEKGKGGE